ncbi:MotE family protein [Candidatus Acidulodesulfobacterium sp. H_13]|uniref:MotE family protein n=1 Tax=Candidatus Acidulodesulfobacterium sp. H_13 TaxID=3395470 RepID=UPI003AF77BCC
MLKILHTPIAFIMFAILSMFLFNAFFAGVANVYGASAKKEEVKVLKIQIKSELEELKKIEVKIHQIKLAQQARVNNLVMLYSSMDPGKAAGILPLIDKNIAVYILSHMSPRVASAIISRMPTKEAVFFTDSIAGRSN